MNDVVVANENLKKTSRLANISSWVSDLSDGQSCILEKSRPVPSTVSYRRNEIGTILAGPVHSSIKK